VIILDTNLISEPLRRKPETRKSGRAIATADAFIAAIALTHNYAVATRDTGPFKAVGVKVNDPWQ